jgi:hypothetical protein
MPLTQSEGVDRLKRLERRLDRQLSVLGVTFGIDGVIGLVPFVGDLVTGAFGLYLVLEARRLGAGRWTMVRMLINWGIDLGIGAVPLIGDVFDVAFKSNTKNVRLLIADLEARASQLRGPNGDVVRAA